jgi:copper(I)-binding protein
MTNIMQFLLWGLAICVVLSACSQSGDALSAHEAWARPALAATGTDSGANLTAVYLTLENRGNQSERLIGVTTEMADTAEIHETQTGDGRAGMQWMDFVEIPPNSAVKFRPGGYHIMLTHLKRDLIAGQTFTIRLQFESGKTLQVVVNVQENPP